MSCMPCVQASCAAHRPQRTAVLCEQHDSPNGVGQARVNAYCSKVYVPCALLHARRQTVCALSAPVCRPMARTGITDHGPLRARACTQRRIAEMATQRVQMTRLGWASAMDSELSAPARPRGRSSMHSLIIAPPSTSASPTSNHRQATLPFLVSASPPRASGLRELWQGSQLW